MSELVQEGLHLAQCEQGRFVVGRFREVHHHAHVWSDVHPLLRDPLSLVFGHPCSTLFALAGVEVGIEHGEIASVAVEHLIRLHVGVVDGNILVLLEGDAIEFVGESEHAADHLVQFKIGSQHLGIDIVFLQFQLVRVVAHVPRHHHKPASLHLFGHLLHGLPLFHGHGFVGDDQVVEQPVHVPCVAGHAVFHHIVGIASESQQLCNLAPEVDEPFADVDVVGIVVVGADGVFGHIHLFSQLPSVRVGHEGRIAGEIEREHPSLLSRLPCGLCGCFDGGVGQSGQVFPVGEMQLEVLVLLEQVLRELQREHAGLLREFSQFLLVLVVEQGSASGEPFKLHLQQPLFLLGEIAVMVVYIFDFLKEPFVQPYVVGVLGQDGLHLLCQGVHLVVGLGAEQVEEDGRHTREQVVVPLGLVVLVHHDGIVKGGSVGIVHNPVNLLVLASDAFHEGFFKMFQLDTVKGHGVVRRVVRFEKRVAHISFLLIFKWICDSFFPNAKLVKRIHISLIFRSFLNKLKQKADFSAHLFGCLVGKFYFCTC